MQVKKEKTIYNYSKIICYIKEKNSLFIQSQSGQQIELKKTKKN